MAESQGMTLQKGWGVDADPENDPTYPMKHRENLEHKGYTWDRPPQQPIDVEVFHSIERPNVTAVFGTSTPPRGLSGALRRIAFHYSESSYAHWLPLVLADRVGAVEGVIDDLLHGRVPNVFAERGWRADWRYNRRALLTRIAVWVGVIVVGVLLVRGRRRRRQR